jgi:putative transposase
VSGHEFTRAVRRAIKAGLQPLKDGKTLANTSPKKIQKDSRTFFVTSKTSLGQALLQTERMANLFIDVLRSYVAAGRFKIHDFVVMPDHFHLLITLDANMTIEKAVQLVKGNFSYRAKKELGFRPEIWQRGFSDERVWDRESFLRHRKYIEGNPVKAGFRRLAGEISLWFGIFPQA